MSVLVDGGAALVLATVALVSHGNGDVTESVDFVTLHVDVSADFSDAALAVVGGRDGDRVLLAAAGGLDDGAEAARREGVVDRGLHALDSLEGRFGADSHLAENNTIFFQSVTAL